MKPLSLPPVIKAGLSLSARSQGDGIFLKLSGNGDTETPGTLGTYLRKLHGEARRVRAQSVTVECDDLYFMSAACIKCLATWIDGITQLDPAERYKVTFSANPHLAWQSRAFDDLRRSASSLVRIVDWVSTPGASSSHTAATPISGTLRQSSTRPHAATVPQAGAYHSATMLRAKGSPSGTMPQPKGSPSGSMPQAKSSPSGSMPQAKGSPSGSMPQAKGSPSGSMPQAKGSPSGSMPQAKGSPSGSMPQAKSSPSGTMPQASGARSATMPPTGTVQRSPASRRRR